MPEQAKSSDIRERVHVEPRQNLGRASVQCRHHVNGIGDGVFIILVVLGGGADDAQADRLGEHEDIAGPSAAVGENARGMNRADNREAEDRFFAFDRVPADDGDAGLRRFVRGALENLGQHRRRQIVRKPHDAQGRERLASHRIDIGQGVRGGDLAEIARIIDDRREEIGGQHQRHFIRNPIDRGVVGRGAADQHIGIGDVGQQAEQR